MTYALTTAEFKTPQGRPVTMTYREDTNDYNTLNACMTEDEYDLRERRVTGTALDIGAYLGGVAIGLALDNPDLRVIAVEGVPQNAELTRQNVAANGLADRVTVIEGAAGGRKPVEMRFGYRGTASLEHHAFVGNSSLAYDDDTIEHDSLTYDKPYTLSSLVKMAGGSIDLLKIDCEGCEYAFLADPALAQVGTILGEWHPIRGNTRATVLALLGDTHSVTFMEPVDGPSGFVAVRQ